MNTIEKPAVEVRVNEFYFFPSTLGFVPAQWKDDGTFTDAWPSDAVLMTDAEASKYRGAEPPAGKQLGQKTGRPAWVDHVPNIMTIEQIQKLRQDTYRAESDHLKTEAEYDAAIAGENPDYTAWLAKVAEIKERYPLPAE